MDLTLTHQEYLFKNNVDQKKLLLLILFIQPGKFFNLAKERFFI